MFVQCAHVKNTNSDFKLVLYKHTPQHNHFRYHYHCSRRNSSSYVWCEQALIQIVTPVQIVCG